jgi:putative inorganic carbon (HCO3(-)) transporter
MTVQTDARSSGVAGVGFALASLLIGGALGWLSVTLGNPMMLLLGGIGLVVVLVAVARPALGLALVAFVTFTRFSDVLVNYHNAPSVMKWFVPLLVLLTLVRWIVAGERPSGWGRPLALLVAYGAVGALSAFYALNPDVSFEALDDYLKNATIAIVVVALLINARTLRYVLWALLAAGTFMATLNVYQFLTNTFDNAYGGFAQASFAGIVGEATGYRIAGPVGDPNFFALVLLILVPISLDRLVSERRLPLRLLAALALGSCLLAIIFTFSRGAFVALSLLGLYAVLRYRRFVVGWLLGIVLAVLLLQYAVPEKYTARLETLLDFLPGSQRNPLSEPAFYGRATEMRAAWYMFQSSPVWGVGLGNSPYRYVEYSIRSGMPGVAGPRAMHSLYLEVAAESGMLGLAAFTAVLWFAFRGMQRARTQLVAAGRSDVVSMLDAVQAGLIAYLAGALFLHGAYPRYFWFMVAVALAIPNLARHELGELANRSRRG